MRNKPVKKITVPEQSREGILRAAGSWQGVDTEAFKAYIKDRRQTGSRIRA